MNRQQDPRYIITGNAMPSEQGYCDQPYIVVAHDGAWVCVMTTGVGKEGDEGQHCISIRSLDQGKTWEAPVDIEPPVPPESSWVMPLIVPSGRIYAFYLYNTTNMREVISDSGLIKRVDTLGDMAYKYSDDHGKSWSAERYIIPIRETKIDRDNPYQGKVRFGWGVGKPIIDGQDVFMGFAKDGHFGHGFHASSECFLLHSDNILTENDPTKIRWQTLPDGDVGLKSPEGPISEEMNVTALSDGSLYCTYRTIQGYNCHAYSRDRGHTWTPSAYATYTPGGRLIKHPRAANFVRKFSNGKFILWFHNNSTKWYFNRNPAWLCGGIEKDGYIHWSEPEILLYDDDPDSRMSYPDFIEEEGRYFAAETQKTVARTHEMPLELLEGMWNQASLKSVATRGLLAEFKARQDGRPAAVAPMPQLPSLYEGGGFALDFWVRFDSLTPGQIILDTRGARLSEPIRGQADRDRRGCDGKGILLDTTERQTIAITITDERAQSSWECDEGLLQVGMWHHVAVIVDGGPKVITFVVDGKLCDGGAQRDFGWGRFYEMMRDVNGAELARVASTLDGQLDVLRIYGRYLRTAEAVGNYQAGR